MNLIIEQQNYSYFSSILLYRICNNSSLINNDEMKAKLFEGRSNLSLAYNVCSDSLFHPEFLPVLHQTDPEQRCGHYLSDY